MDQDQERRARVEALLERLRLRSEAGEALSVGEEVEQLRRADEERQQQLRDALEGRR